MGGVGYRLTIPLSTFYRLGEPGGEVTLLAHTHVREDALALFGFLTAVEQALFERLIAVSGVGPKLAVAILSGIEAPDLVAALRAGDVVAPHPDPRRGQEDRGAARPRAQGQGARASPPPRSRPPPPRPRAAPRRTSSPPSLHLGYSRQEAERGVDRALKEGRGPVRGPPPADPAHPLGALD